MRWISQKHLQRFADLAPIEACDAAIAQLGDANERNEYIDNNSGTCSALRGPLWAIGCAKCWYSEASLQQAQGHVEHYRPKKALHGAAHLGYWWRAFDWRNLRLAHPTVNLRVTDYLSGKKTGKGRYFPLKHPNVRATSATDEVAEEPVLLDPTRPYDTLLLRFDETSCRPVPRYKKEDDAWLHRRAVETIEFYHLDEGTWNMSRYDLMREVKALCEHLLVLAAAEPRDQSSYTAAINEILSYIDPFAEFSAACMQVVLGYGVLELVISPEEA
jgi:hypothetical protein